MLYSEDELLINGNRIIMQNAICSWWILYPAISEVWLEKPEQ